MPDNLLTFSWNLDCSSSTVVMLSKTTFILFLILILSTCLRADTRESDLKALFDCHQWFDLRDAVSKHGASAFYKGVPWRVPLAI